MKPNLTYKTVITIDLLDISHRELALIWDALSTSSKVGAHDVWDKIDELIRELQRIAGDEEYPYRFVSKHIGELGE